MEADMRYATELLRRINGLEINGKTLTESFSDPHGYSYWTFQQFFLLVHIKEFSKHKNYRLYQEAFRGKYGFLSNFFASVFAFLVFLASLLGALLAVLRRPTAVTFTSDTLQKHVSLNLRIQNIHLYLKRLNIPYVELLHVTSAKNFFSNIWRRKGASVYLDAFETFSEILSLLDVRIKAPFTDFDTRLEDATDDEIRFIRHMIFRASRAVAASRIKVHLLRSFLRIVSPQVFISADDMRYVSEILLSCEEEGIPTHVFQHSNFDYVTGVYDLPAQAYIFPKEFYVWNQYWLKRTPELNQFFSFYKNRLRIGGRSFTPSQPPATERQEPVTHREALCVLVPYEVSLRTEHIRPYLDAMLDDGRIKVLFVLRGTIDQIDSDTQIRKYISEKNRTSPRLRIIEPSGRAEAIRSCDVVAGVYSGFLDESLEAGVPVAIFKTGYLNVNRLDMDDLAGLVDINGGSIFDQFLRVYSTPNGVLKLRRERVTVGTVSIDETLGTILDRSVREQASKA